MPTTRPRPSIGTNSSQSGNSLEEVSQCPTEQQEVYQTRLIITTCRTSPVEQRVCCPFLQTTHPANGTIPAKQTSQLESGEVVQLFPVEKLKPVDWSSNMEGNCSIYSCKSSGRTDALESPEEKTNPARPYVEAAGSIWSNLCPLESHRAAGLLSPEQGRQQCFVWFCS